MRNKKNLLNLRKQLINYIIEKEFSVGGFHKKNHNLIQNNNTVFRRILDKEEGNYCIFDIDIQINQIIKVYRLLQKLKAKKKPIFFFGINDFYFREDSRNNFAFLDINKKIFELCFSVNASKEGQKYKEIFENFVKKFYINFYGNHYISETRFDFLKLIKKFNLFFSGYVKVKRNDFIAVERSGYFFENWEGGYFSNFNELKYNLEKNPVKGSFKRGVVFEKLLLEPLLIFIRRFRTLITLDSYFKDHSGNLPGAVFFFCKPGYEHFFKEFKHLGIPVICIVNSDDCIKDIDYPLFGDSSEDDVILFYCQIVKYALKVNLYDSKAKAFLSKNKTTSSN